MSRLVPFHSSFYNYHNARAQYNGLSQVIFQPTSAYHRANSNLAEQSTRMIGLYDVMIKFTDQLNSLRRQFNLSEHGMI